MAPCLADAGILGKRLIGASIGQVEPGDDYLNDVDDSVVSYGVNLRLPVNANLDVIAGMSQSQLEGDDPFTGESIEADGTSLQIGVQYQFSPGEKINPNIAVGFGRVDVDVEVDGVSADDDDTGGFLQAGVEFGLQDNVSLNVGAVYTTEIFDEDDFSGAAALNIWATEQVLLSVGASYSFDSEDVGVSAGAALGF